MVSKKRLLQRILGGTDKLIEKFEEEWQKEKNEESKELYHAIREVLVEHKPSPQNVLFVLKMIEYGYLQATYRELVEGTVKIPKGSVPLAKEK